MKPRLITLVVGACSAVAMIAAANDPVTPAITVPNEQVAALSGIDVPLIGDRGKELIEATYGAQPLAALIRIARGLTDDGEVNPDADPGVRIRAYRAIGLYETAAAKAVLTTDLTALAGAQPGTEQLILRAVIEALGELGEPQDVPLLTPFLDYEQSRDIRAATADALRVIKCACDPALDPLRDRLSIETSDQVRLAISRALRELDQTP